VDPSLRPLVHAVGVVPLLIGAAVLGWLVGYVYLRVRTRALKWSRKRPRPGEWALVRLAGEVGAVNALIVAGAVLWTGLHYQPDPPGSPLGRPDLGILFRVLQIAAVLALLGYDGWRARALLGRGQGREGEELGVLILVLAGLLLGWGVFVAQALV
jgi:hypothetical protein